MTDLILSELWRFPMKSAAGQALERGELGPRGLEQDRHWMLVDLTGGFLTQRQLPRMALITTALDAAGALHLSAPGMPPCPVRARPELRVAVRVWGDTCLAAACDEGTDAWLSDFLAQPCRLVYLPTAERRPVDPHYAQPEDQVGFADGFPLLLISQASLDDLNTRLTAPIPMRRFRPNLVVAGSAPYAEDAWRVIRIGAIVMRVVKPCSRCPIPNVDPDTGIPGSEVLRTLTRYRRRDNKVYFGQNLLHDGPGVLTVGMPVEILETVDD